VKRRHVIAVTGAALGGFVAGAVLTLTLQGSATIPENAPRPPVSAAVTASTTRERPDTYLAWTAGGLPTGFADLAARAIHLRRQVVVASDTAWLTRSFDEDGEVVDDPPPTYSIPLEVAAVDPETYAPFLPPADRSVTVALAHGEGVLGESSAKLRGLGVGATLRFGDVDVEIAAVLPDELVGAHELLVARDVGERLGVTHDRYALLVPDGQTTTRKLTAALDHVLPAGTLLRVRAPGDTPYFRQGDAVLPPVIIKTLFGEFAARPRPGDPGYLDLDPAWVRSHIATEHVRLLGDVTCNVAMFPQIRGAIDELIRRGLSDTITSFSGCYSPRRVNRIPTAGISHHTWGIALDINVPQNPFGAPPDQDPRMVAVFERWGFIWGGSFVQPDGMHFEYRRPPANA
jgi:D-alanyl-D-alanine carboxypeptidase-like protein